MVTTRMTVEEHAKQLVSHGAHAADIEVVEGLLAELEKSKKTIESLRELTRKQFGLPQNMMDDVVHELSRSKE